MQAAPARARREQRQRVAAGGRQARRDQRPARPRPSDFSDRRARGWINGEMRVSWSDAAAANPTRCCQGAGSTPRPRSAQLSVDQMWVEMFHLKLGDTLTPARRRARHSCARVTSVRGVRWDSFRANFFLMLDPASGADLPHSCVASFHLPAAPRQRSRRCRAISRTCPWSTSTRSSTACATSSTASAGARDVGARLQPARGRARAAGRARRDRRRTPLRDRAAAHARRASAPVVDRRARPSSPRSACSPARSRRSAPARSAACWRARCSSCPVTYRRCGR